MWKTALAVSGTTVAAYSVWDRKKNRHYYDAAVIGGGVVGLSVARELSARGSKVVILEKENDILTGASSGNSGLGCTGYDAAPGTLEYRLLRRSTVLHQNLYRRLGLSYEHVNKCGALMVAWNSKDEEILPSIIKESIDAGDTENKILSKSNLFTHEPKLSPSALSGIYVKRENVVEPFMVAVAHAASALLHGAVLRVGFDVGVIINEGNHYTVASTTGDQIKAKTIINCSGLYGDDIEKLRYKDHSLVITPRKGEFAVLKSPPGFELDHIIQPPPQAVGKGVQIWQSLYGNIIVGPTADNMFGPDAKTNRSTTTTTIDMLVKTAKERIPALETAQLVGSYSGLRPASNHSDYLIEKNGSWITVAGIRSTGLSAASGIGEYVANMYYEVDQPNNDRIQPPYLPVVPTVHKQSPQAPSLQELAESFCSRGDGKVDAFGSSWTVTHPISVFGLQSKCRRD